MGFGKKISEPIRVIAVCKEQAVDWSQTPRLEYVESRDDALVKLKPDEDPPIWFTLIPGLAPGQVARINSMSGDERYLWAFVFGVTDCTPNPLGLHWENSEGQRRVEFKTMKSVPADVWREIGSLVLQREELSEGEEPRFSL